MARSLHSKSGPGRNTKSAQRRIEAAMLTQKEKSAKAANEAAALLASGGLTQAVKAHIVHSWAEHCKDLLKGGQ